VAGAGIVLEVKLAAHPSTISAKGGLSAAK